MRVEPMTEWNSSTRRQHKQSLLEKKSEESRRENWMDELQSIPQQRSKQWSTVAFNQRQSQAHVQQMEPTNKYKMQPWT